MSRTIILTLAPPSSSDRYSEHWSVMEEGRICDGLCWDEMLGVVARVTLNESNTYAMRTVDEHKDFAKRRATPPRLEYALRQLVDAFNDKEAAGLLQGAFEEAARAIAEADAYEVPF